MTCPSCGTENAAGNRFCMKCGADMTATTPVEAGSAGATGSGFGYIPQSAMSGDPAPMSGDPAPGTQERYGNAGYAPGPNGYSAPPQFAPNPLGYGASPTMGVVDLNQLAGIGSRFLSYILDVLVILAGFIVVVIVAAILSAIHLRAIGVLLVFIYDVAAIVYMPYFWVTRAGQTIGMKAMRVRVVKTNGSPVTVGPAILRIIGFYIVDSIIFGIPVGILWCLWDAKRQCWHDKMADTIVIRA